MMTEAKACVAVLLLLISCLALPGTATGQV